MPVSIPLNELQRSTVDKAVKGTKIVPVFNGRSLTITAENALQIREALEELRMKKFKIKTKTVDHLETCFAAQEIIKRIDSAMNEFSNDNTIGVIVEGPIEVLAGEEMEVESGTTAEDNNEATETNNDDSN